MCLSTGPRWPGGPSSCQKQFTLDFCLCGAILIFYVCLAACVGLPSKGPNNLLAQGLICPKSGTWLHYIYWYIRLTHSLSLSLSHIMIVCPILGHVIRPPQYHIAISYIESLKGTKITYTMMRTIHTTVPTRLAPINLVISWNKIKIWGKNNEHTRRRTQSYDNVFGQGELKTWF